MRRTTPFAPEFATHDPFFLPIRSLAQEVAAYSAAENEAFPSPATLDAVLAHRAGVRFQAALPKPRRRRGRAPKDMYDSSIVEAGVVPTRPGSWHDLLNALVWAAFPRSKRALHAAQLSMVRERLDPHTGRMEGARARAHDALALLDEGGAVVLLRGGGLPGDSSELSARVRDRSAAVLVFGHALYETMVYGGTHTTARAQVHTVHDLPGELPVQLALADALFEGAIVGRAIPDEGVLPRLDVRAVLGPA
jgi:hypothetical protein